MGRREVAFKSSGVSVGDPDLLREVESPPVGIRTPIEIGTGRSGIFQMNFSTAEQVADNLKNLILTNHGERLGNYYFGANLRPLTVEISSQENFESVAMERISIAVSKHMKFINLETFTSDANKMVDHPQSSVSPASMAVINLVIKYNAPSFGITGQSLNVQLFCI
jgi:phage baseplate assembly protein W